MLQLTMLGTSGVRTDDGAVLSLDAQQPKRLALLAYLAAARPFGPHRRDVVVSLFWPEQDDARARASLRQALHGVRKVLGAQAIASHGVETLELSRTLFACDVWELEAASGSGDDQRVVELYAGDFLAGLHLSEAPAFEHWVDGERTRLRGIAANSAWAVAERAAQARSSGLAGCVRSALALSGLDECALRKGMRLLADIGDRASAISAYERFAAELRRELEVDVDPETRALAVELRQTVAPSAAGERADAPVTEMRYGIARVPGADVPPPVKRNPVAAQRRAAMAAAAGLIALAAAARYASGVDAQADPRRVDVGAFSNETTIRELDAVAQRATLDARAALAQLQGVAVTASAGSGGTLVRAILRSDGDSVALRAEVVDVRSGAVVRTVVGRKTPLARVTEALPLFTDRLAAAVATALYPGWGSVLSEPPSYSAYRDFLAGMRAIKRERHEDAIASFRRAFAEDSSFTAAGLLAGMELYQVRKFAAADSVATAIARRGNTLRPLDERLLDWLTRSLGGDRLGARAAMQMVVALAPMADLAWLQLAIDNVETGRPNEALAALDHIDRGADFGEGWASFWATRIEALHLMGEHGRELAAARDGLSRHPELRVLVTYELRALAALGRVDELNARIRSLPTRLDSTDVVSESMVRQVALELSAHGNAAAAQRLLQRLAGSYAQLETSGQRRADPLSAARTHYLAGDYAKATPIYDSVYRAHPRCLDCAGMLGVIAARRGDRATAERHAQTLSTPEAAARRYLFGRPLLWRARIANILGDKTSAAALLTAAFARGLEFDVMTHADPDLMLLRPDSIYRAFSLVR
jgi:DNA-binding SARP family transcriptional activator